VLQNVSICVRNRQGISHGDCPRKSRVLVHVHERLPSTLLLFKILQALFLDEKLQSACQTLKNNTYSIGKEDGGYLTSISICSSCLLAGHSLATKKCDPAPLLVHVLVCLAKVPVWIFKLFLSSPTTTVSEGVVECWSLRARAMTMTMLPLLWSGLHLRVGSFLLLLAFRFKLVS